MFFSVTSNQSLKTFVIRGKDIKALKELGGGHHKRATEEEFSLPLPELVSHIRSESFVSDVCEWEVCVGW